MKKQLNGNFFILAGFSKKKKKKVKKKLALYLQNYTNYYYIKFYDIFSI